MAADEGFRIVGGDVIAETPFLRVEELSLESPDGSVAQRSVVGVALLVWLFSSLGQRNIYGVVQGRGRGH